MRHSNTRYRYGKSDIYARRMALHDAHDAREAANQAFDDALIDAVDDGMSFLDVANEIGVPKPTVHRWYHQAKARRQESSQP